MEHYEKTRTEDNEETISIPGVAENAPKMFVSAGSKIKNLMGFAMKKLEDTSVDHILWTGHGKAISKVISCAEIMKRRVKHDLFQITQVRYKRITDVWEPKDKSSDLDALKVNKDIPSISILLSKLPLDDRHPSYQPPGDFNEFWHQRLKLDENDRKTTERITKVWCAELSSKREEIRKERIERANKERKELLKTTVFDTKAINRWAKQHKMESQRAERERRRIRNLLKDSEEVIKEPVKSSSAVFKTDADKGMKSQQKTQSAQSSSVASGIKTTKQNTNQKHDTDARTGEDRYGRTRAKDNKSGIDKKDQATKPVQGQNFSSFDKGSGEKKQFSKGQGPKGQIRNDQGPKGQGSKGQSQNRQRNVDKASNSANDQQEQEQVPYHMPTENQAEGIFYGPPTTTQDQVLSYQGEAAFQGAPTTEGQLTSLEQAAYQQNYQMPYYQGLPNQEQMSYYQGHANEEQASSYQGSEGNWQVMPEHYQGQRPANRGRHQGGQQNWNRSKRGSGQQGWDQNPGHDSQDWDGYQGTSRGWTKNRGRNSPNTPRGNMRSRGQQESFQPRMQGQMKSRHPNSQNSRARGFRSRRPYESRGTRQGPRSSSGQSRNDDSEVIDMDTS